LSNLISLAEKKGSFSSPSIVFISHVPKIPFHNIYFFGMVYHEKKHALVTKFLLGCPGVAQLLV
jgi:hypothetical protein